MYQVNNLYNKSLNRLISQGCSKPKLRKLPGTMFTKLAIAMIVGTLALTTVSGFAEGIDPINQKAIQEVESINCRPELQWIDNASSQQEISENVTQLVSDIQNFTEEEVFQNLTKKEKLGFFDIVRSFIRPGLPFEPSLSMNFHYNGILKIGMYALPVLAGFVVPPALVPFLVATEAGVFAWQSYATYQDAFQEAQIQISKMQKVCNRHGWQSKTCAYQIENTEKAMRAKEDAQW